MSWAKFAKEALSRGEFITVTPHGNSMRPKIHSGDHVTLKPITDDIALEKGDIVLVHYKSNDYIHKITAIKKQKDKTQFQIGNNQGGINGWVNANAIFGLAVKIRRPHRDIDDRDPAETGTDPEDFPE
jgi:signal peptidase I